MRRSACPPVTILVLALFAALPLRAEPLPAIAAELSRTTVSGLSSGAYMAGQFQVAYSQIVIGAGLVAGGPYGCARTPGSELNPFWSVTLSWNLSRAKNRCMSDGWFLSTVPNPADLVQHAKTLAEAGKIDALANLRQDKVYLFSSMADDTVEIGVVEAAAEFYLKAGIPEVNIDFEKHMAAGHAFLTDSGGSACGVSGPPYLNDCHIDQANAILTQLYGELQPPAAVVEMNFLRFEQAPFLQGPEDPGLDQQGVAYIPSNCRQQAGCAVHVVFHGCKQDTAAVGDQFVKGAGYVRWAEGNRIVLLFPQVKPGPLNPDGCWDWWGYTGPKFLERNAPQMLAVKRMLDRLAERP